MHFSGASNVDIVGRRSLYTGGGVLWRGGRFFFSNFPVADPVEIAHATHPLVTKTTDNTTTDNER